MCTSCACLQLSSLCSRPAAHGTIAFLTLLAPCDSFGATCDTTQAAAQCGPFFLKRLSNIVVSNRVAGGRARCVGA